MGRCRKKKIGNSEWRAIAPKLAKLMFLQRAAQWICAGAIAVLGLRAASLVRESHTDSYPEGEYVLEEDALIWVQSLGLLLCLWFSWAPLCPKSEETKASEGATEIVETKTSAPGINRSAQNENEDEVSDEADSQGAEGIDKGSRSETVGYSSPYR